MRIMALSSMASMVLGTDSKIVCFFGVSVLLREMPSTEVVTMVLATLLFQPTLLGFGMLFVEHLRSLSGPPDSHVFKPTWVCDSCFRETNRT